jgi:hypothetical protein
MDKVVRQNAANAEESASASEELNAQAEQLVTLIVICSAATRRRFQSGVVPPHSKLAYPILDASQVALKLDNFTETGIQAGPAQLLSRHQYGRMAAPPGPTTLASLAGNHVVDMQRSCRCFLRVSSIRS